MTNLEGKLCRLRALEPQDLKLLYAWENDPAIWGVSGTTAPFSALLLQRFIDEQVHDIYATRQMRLVIETLAGESIGLLDLFEFDPQHLRAGVGILIHDATQRGQGYASDAMAILIAYASTTLHIHQLWCNVEVDNTHSLALFHRAGFTEVGIKRSWNFTPQGWKDEILLQHILV
ncbi:MAG: GNAT family protein [Alistipes sp.]